MATEYKVSDYLNSKLIRLGIELSDVEIAVLNIKYIIPITAPDSVLDQNNIALVDKACLYQVRDLLLAPEIVEGGYSIKYDKESVTKWYNSEVHRLGLSNNIEFSLAPKIRDASNYW